MLHGVSSRRLILISPYLHLPKLSYPSVFIHLTPDFLCYHNGLLDFFGHLLRQCTTIRQCQQLHAQFFFTGAYCSAYLAARLVSTYTRLGLLNDARKAFNLTLVECPSNLLLWNSILRANVMYGGYEEALRVYCQMRKLGVAADGFTFPLVIRACAQMGDPRLCKIIHSHACQKGLQYHLHVANELLGIYGKIGDMDDARKLFDKMPVRSHISWNTIVSGFALNFDPCGALEMFHHMELEGFEPNAVTWTSLLSSHARCGYHEETLSFYDVMRKKGIGTTAESLAVVISVCADLSAFDKGEVIHGYVIRGGFESYVFVKNSLICMYGKDGAIDHAETLFSEMESKNLVSWNALISSYAESGLSDEAFALFSELENSNSVVRPNVISWSAVIGGFASKGHGEKSLELFRRMQLAKVAANSITISTILSVCAELSGLGIGREIHGYLIKAAMDRNNLVANGLINMYAKCGSLRKAHLVFEKIDGRDLISWNSMIAGYGMHGLGNDALKTFKEMIKAGYHPDGITFVAVLSACSHSGLVSDGRKLFSQMKENGVEPQVEHYSCIVDLLGRAGFLQQAVDVVRSMPMEPNAFVWGSLLNSCRMHKYIDIAEETASQILNLDPKAAGSGSYMMVSDIYAANGKWEDSARARISAKTKGLKKIPGQSWIEVKKKVHVFAAGNALQTGIGEVYKTLKYLGLQMEMEGYVQDTNFLAQDGGEEMYS
ncbi:hypothetical protein NMG60_11013048 [Bertholletia excelsa]